MGNRKSRDLKGETADQWKKRIVGSRWVKTADQWKKRIVGSRWVKTADQLEKRDRGLKVGENRGENAGSKSKVQLGEEGVVL